MIDLYRSGTTAKQVAEKFGVSLSSVKRLLHRYGVRRAGRTSALTVAEIRDTGSFPPGA
jgi:transposase